MPSIRKRGQTYQTRLRINGKNRKSFASLKSAERWVESKTTKDNPKVAGNHIAKTTKSAIRYAPA